MAWSECEGWDFTVVMIVQEAWNGVWLLLEWMELCDHVIGAI